MDKEQEMDPRFHFSHDPDEEMSFENEILKLKLQAERGAIFGGNREEIPPEIEQEFLKNVQLFEDSYDKAKMVSVYEYIGKPNYKKLNELEPENVNIELVSILKLMCSKNVVLDVIEEYDPSVIYKFITEELFLAEISDFSLPGYTVNFIYEEFHPNHKADIGNLAQQFIDHWFEKSFDDSCSEFAGELVTPEGKMYGKQEVISKLRNCLECYHTFKNIKFKGSSFHFEWDEVEAKGLGHAEGAFKYVAELGNGQNINIEGPFKLYVANEYGLWKIFYFVFPGFEWD